MKKKKSTKARVWAGKHKPVKARETDGDPEAGDELRMAFEQFLRRLGINRPRGPQFSRRDLFDR